MNDLNGGLSYGNDKFILVKRQFPKMSEENKYPLVFKFPIRCISKDNEKAFNRHTGRPFTSRRFKDFEESLRVLLKPQLPSNFKMIEEEGIIVELNLTFADKRRPDVGNCPKSLLDAYNKILWKDDKLITVLITTISYGKEDEIELVIVGMDK